MASVASEPFLEYESPRLPVSLTDLRLASLNHTSGRWITWWRPDDAGYTEHLDEAGVYTFQCVKERAWKYRSIDVLVVPDYIARRFARPRDQVQNAASTWAVFRGAALFQVSADLIPRTNGRRGRWTHG
jgi:hypothetical protein